MKQPELGRVIQNLRQSKGLTQIELAKSCNVSLRTIQRIESTEVAPRSYTVRTILSSLGCDYEEFSKDLSDDRSQTCERPRQHRREHLFKNVQEFINLKTKTMKRISVVSLFAILILSGVFISVNAFSPVNASTDNPLQIKGWFLAGSKPADYKISRDTTVFRTGSSSALLESTKNSIDGFGTLMQSASVLDYLGKRVKMSAYIKTQDVSDWAGMWMRVDANNSRNFLRFDNMQNRPLTGTSDWTKYEIVLDVPDISGSINFGVLLSGTGKVWMDDVQFEIVDKSVPETSDLMTKMNKQPTNLDFE